MSRITATCKACNGTGNSRYHEGRDCDICDGRGTVTSYTEAPYDGTFALDPNRKGEFGAALIVKEAAANAEP